MNRYIAILRGINVGGHKKILMAELKKKLENLGFKDVITYIQSGNVIFGSKIDDAPELKKELESMIEKQYGFQVPIIIRKQEDLQKVVNEDPFVEIEKKENGSKLHVVYLSDVPTDKAQASLNDIVQDPERIVLKGNHLYIWYPNGAGHSKITTQVIERKLDVQATARNWMTTLKLLELSKP
jgi:uncharacterized protein (DUF1697 family)